MQRSLRLFMVIGLVLALAGAGYLVLQNPGQEKPTTIAYGDLSGQSDGSEKPVGDTAGGSSGGTRDGVPAEGGEGVTSPEGGTDGGAPQGGGTTGGDHGAYVNPDGSVTNADGSITPGTEVTPGHDGTTGNGAPQPDANGNYVVPDVTNPETGGVAPGRTGPINPGGKSGAIAGDAKGSVEAGEHTGGSDMAAGVWRSSPGCVYSVNGVQSPLQNGGQALVEIRDGDAFSSQCSWKGGAGGSSASVSYGWHIGGRDMAAGAWQPSGSECALTLMSDLRSNAVVAGSEFYTSTRENVIIENGDILYSTSGCGSWSKVG